MEEEKTLWRIVLIDLVIVSVMWVILHQTIILSRTLTRRFILQRTVSEEEGSDDGEELITFILIIPCRSGIVNRHCTVRL